MSGLLQSGGQTSSMRVMAFMSLITGCVIGLVGMWKGTDLIQTAALVGVYMAPIAAKVVQKRTEVA